MAAVVTQLHCLQTTPGVCLCLLSGRQPIKQRSLQHQCQHWCYGAHAPHVAGGCLAGCKLVGGPMAGLCRSRGSCACLEVVCCPLVFGGLCRWMRHVPVDACSAAAGGVDGSTERLRVCELACQLGLVKERLRQILRLPLCLGVVGLSGNAS